MKSLAESPIVRITPRSKAILNALSRQEGKPMQAVLDEALEKYRRDKLLDAANEAFAALRKDPAAWKREQSERALWDQTSVDGLEVE